MTSLLFCRKKHQQWEEKFRISGQMLEYFSLASVLHALLHLIFLLCTSCVCIHFTSAALVTMRENALSVLQSTDLSWKPRETLSKTPKTKISSSSMLEIRKMGSLWLLNTLGRGLLAKLVPDRPVLRWNAWLSIQLPSYACKSLFPFMEVQLENVAINDEYSQV